MLVFNLKALIFITIGTTTTRSFILGANHAI